jgi:RimJ/RimL family protein N-acetyltransferase
LTGLPVGAPVEGAEASRPVARQLAGRYVKLQRLSAEVHAEDLWQVVGGMHHAALWRYMGEGPFADGDEFAAAMRRAEATEDPVFYAIVDVLTGKAVGRASFLNIRAEHRSVEAGHLMYSPLLQRTRGATETFYLMAQYAFDELRYRRLEWKCDALNAKSRRAAERLGFRFEGIFRQHLIIKGRNRDTAWFSIIDTEWPAIKDGLEKWLAEDNFDEQGRQRKRLGASLGTSG